MLIRSLLLPHTQKIRCYTFYPHIRYGSDWAKNNPNKNSPLPSPPKVLQPILDKFSKKFPRLSAIYSLIYGGMREILEDVKSFFAIMRKTSESEEGLKTLSLEELEFYHSFKLSTKKLLPIVLLGVLPFGNALIIPLVYFKPRRAVTHHFWTENQKARFPLEEYEDRLRFREGVLNFLKDCPSGRMPDKVYADWRKLQETLNHDGRPEVSDVLKVSSLFQRGGPFYLQLLPKLHVIQLGCMYGVTSLFSPLGKTIRFAEYNLIVDRKILQIGGPKALPHEIRSKICYIKGVDSMNMSPEEQISYLQKWIELNAKINISNYSLMLHTPVLLGYNKSHVKFNPSQKR